PGGNKQQERSPNVACDALEQIEQSVFGPVEVLDQHDGRLLGRELAEQRDPGGVKAVACRQRMKVARDVEPEGEPEQIAAGESRPHLLGRVALEDAELLLQNLPERPVRDALSVREAAAGAPQRLRLLLAEELPELTDETGLADARFAEHRDEARTSLLR